LVIGLTLKFLHNAYLDKGGIGGEKFPAPQATLMATIIKGVMSQKLDWSYLMIGAGLSLTVYLCGVSPLAWAVGVYLPISTTFPIFVGGMLRALCDKLRGKAEESEVSSGMLFATGLVAGGTLTGVFSALLKAIPWTVKDPVTGEPKEQDILATLQEIGEGTQKQIAEWLQEHFHGAVSLDAYSLVFFIVMGFVLVGVAMKKSESIGDNS
jgi:OPT oligopeptide transporter protein